MFSDLLPALQPTCTITKAATVLVFPVCVAVEALMRVAQKLAAAAPSLHPLVVLVSVSIDSQVEETGFFFCLNFAMKDLVSSFSVFILHHVFSPQVLKPCSFCRVAAEFGATLESLQMCHWDLLRFCA